MEIQLLHTGKFTFAQKRIQRTNAVFIGLSVSGLKKKRIYRENSRKVFELHDRMLIMLPENTMVDFAYDEHRENFVTICRIPELQWDGESEFAEIGNIRIPMFVSLSEERLFALREIFERMIELENSGLPEAFAAAELFIHALLAELIAANTGISRRTGIIAANLRQEIDADDHFTMKLTDIIRKTGVSPAFARKKFTAEFGVSPNEYRTRKRRELLLHLLTHTTLAPKEIAERAGMKNVTHLHSFMKKHFNMTPKQLRGHMG